MSKYVLYTDGSCDINKGGEGSWAYVIVDPETDISVRSCAQRVMGTTNNRMELQAIIEGLKQFRKDTSVEVISDSAYVVNCFLQKWYVKWRQNNWYSSSGPVKNPDLWQELLSLAESFVQPITWTHIRGHQGNKWNECCDRLCTQVRTSNPEKSSR